MTIASTLAQVFNLPALSGEFKARPSKPGLPYPSVKEHFAFTEGATKRLLRFFSGQSAHNNLLIFGPAGCGKTATLEQVAARLGWPVWAVSCSGRVRTATWFGSMALRDGSTVWQDGPLTLALRNGGLFIADEVTRLDPSEQMALVRVLDGGSIVIPETGETLTPHKLFRFAATGNSAGHGDATGNYAGERTSSVAFLDRFLKMEAGFLPEAQETSLLMAAVRDLPEQIARAIVRVAANIRSAGASGAMRTGMSTRATLAIAYEAMAYHKAGSSSALLDAVTDVTLAGAPEEEAGAIRDLVTKFISE